MHTAELQTTRSLRSRKSAVKLSDGIRAMIDECGAFDADAEYRAKRKREEGWRAVVYSTGRNRLCSSSVKIL